MMIGRERARKVVEAALDSAVDGQGSTVIVSGETGIGKTALLRGIGTASHRAEVIYEWFREGEPFTPWPEVLRKLQPLLSQDERARTEELHKKFKSDEMFRVAVPVDETSLFHELAEIILAAARRRPVLLLLDDLVWAPLMSLRFLKHLARELWHSPLCLVLASHGSELPAEHVLNSTLDELGRTATTVTLTGMTPDEAGNLIERQVGHPVPPDVQQELQERSGGNPLFLNHAVRLWQSTGSLSIVPQQVEDILQRRLVLLPPKARQVLEHACLIGREFNVELLYRTLEIPRGEFNVHVGTLQHAGIVHTVGPASMAFVHAIVIELLLPSISADRARGIHAQIVACASAHPADFGLTPTILAAHADNAGSNLHPEVRCTLHTAAAHYCVNQMSTGDALEHFRLAHRCLPPEPTYTLANALLNLASHLGWRGIVGEAEAHFRSSFDIAMQLDDPELAGRVALAMHTLVQHQKTLTGDFALSSLVAAYVKLYPDHSQMDYKDVNGIVNAVTTAIADRAGSRDDPRALIAALWGQYDASMNPVDAPVRASILQRLNSIAHSTNDTLLTRRVAALRWAAAIEVADSQYLRGFLSGPSYRIALPLPDQIALDLFLGHKDAARALLRPAVPQTGDNAESLDDEALLIAHLAWTEALHENKLDEADSLIAYMSASHPYTWIQQALTDLRRGDIHLAEMSFHRLNSVPTTLKPLVYRVMAEAAALSLNPEMLDSVSRCLTPLEGRWLVSAHGSDISGPVDLWLGRLARIRGNRDEARGFLTRAEESAMAMMSVPWQLECRLELALLDNNTILVRDTVAKAQRLGLYALASTGFEMIQAPATPRPIMQRISSGWSIDFMGQKSTFPSRKGFRDVHTLLSNPGQDISAFELLVGPEDYAQGTQQAIKGGDVLDPETKRQLGTEIKRLDEEIESALNSGHDDRAQKLDRERDQLIAYIKRATGLFNKPRRLGDDGERARKTVSSRIKHAINLIEVEIPELAKHLDKRIELGAQCRYIPADPQPDDAL